MPKAHFGGRSGFPFDTRSEAGTGTPIPEHAPAPLSAPSVALSVPATSMSEPPRLSWATLPSTPVLTVLSGLPLAASGAASVIGPSTPESIRSSPVPLDYLMNRATPRSPASFKHADGARLLPRGFLHGATE